MLLFIYSYFFKSLNLHSMNETQLQKKEWVKPEMVDLDVDKTANGATPSDPELTAGQSGYS